MFSTMCLKEQQTSDNVIVKDCFIIEIFDKFSFSGILKGCLSHLNEAYSVQPSKCLKFMTFREGYFVIRN